MNAKEFAHKLEKAASFIRQQQAEIEALKEGIEKLKDAYCQRDSQVRQQQAEIEALKDKLMLTKQSLEIVEGWVNHG